MTISVSEEILSKYLISLFLALHRTVTFFSPLTISSIISKTQGRHLPVLCVHPPPPLLLIDGIGCFDHLNL